MGQFINSNGDDLAMNIVACWDTKKTPIEKYMESPHTRAQDKKAKNRKYQAETMTNPFQNGAFSFEQMEKLYKMFSSLQTSNQLSTKSPSSSLAHKSNFLKTLSTITQYKVPWIIDSAAFDHMTDSHHLFSIYSPCVDNFKVKIIDVSFSSVARKGNIRISHSITLEYVFHVSKLSCNLLSISQLIKNFNCSANFFSLTVSHHGTRLIVLKSVRDSITLKRLM